MKEPHKRILVKNCLNKSKQALSDAEYNLKDGRDATALNRIYYSIFYSVAALAYKSGFTTSSHSQLMGWFNKKFLNLNSMKFINMLTSRGKNQIIIF